MAASFNRVRLGGSIVGGEVWSVSFAFVAQGIAGGAITEFEDLQQWAEDIGDLNGGDVLPQDLQDLISGACTLDTIRTEALTAAGVLLQAAQFAIPVPVVGSVAATKTPQTALVASLQSGRPGRSFNGRIYWPALSGSIGATTLRLTTGATLLYAQATAALLTDVGNATDAAMQMTPVIASLATASQTEISSIRVGDILDTQRRRRDAYIERYSSVAL